MIISDDEIKKIVVQNGIVTEQQIVPLVEAAKNAQVSLSDILIDKDLISDENLGILIADYCKIPFVVLSKTFIPDDVIHIVPARIARKHKVIAFARDQHGVKLAMADPKNREIMEMIAKKTNQPVFPFYATERDIENTFHIYKRNLQKSFDELIKEEVGKTTAMVLNDAPIVTIVDLLIDYAYQDKASDIHIEPEEKNSLVRFRIDGILHDVLALPSSLHDRIVTRIKVLSRLRTDEHLAAQDGKMRAKLEEEDLDIRVSILPIVEGEKVVMRLLSSHSRKFSLTDLGMNQRDLDKVTAAFSKAYGMILSTGPTGSGKSTSIYSILKILNIREKNITTIEDPVEYHIQGVNQIQVNPKTDLTFANGLRSILRQDPNIIFVGEIRDNETAGIAVNAALTGHLVLSTLHTNDAATALPRLMDMDVEPFLVASTVNVIIAQRLIRKICDSCKGLLTVTREELEKNIPKEMVDKHFGSKNEIHIYKGSGCKICHNTGYAGRIGVFEVLEVSNRIKELIAQKNDSDVILQEAIKEGMTTMFDDGLDKVVKGITSLEEILRVTKVESL